MSNQPFQPSPDTSGNQTNSYIRILFLYYLNNDYLLDINKTSMPQRCQMPSRSILLLKALDHVCLYTILQKNQGSFINRLIDKSVIRMAEAGDTIFTHLLKNPNNLFRPV